jgi:hypothetical protein
MRGWGSNRVFGLILVGLLASACDGIWDLQRLGPPPIPDGPPEPDAPDAPPPDGMGELGFSMPKLIVPLTSTSDDAEPTLRADRLEIYFKSNRTGVHKLTNIWRATRGSVDVDWSEPLEDMILSSDELDTSPRISTDGLTMWIKRTGAVNSTFVSKRDTVDSMWSEPEPEMGLDAAMGDDQFGSSDPDTLVGYLTSKRGITSSRAQLFRTTRTSSSVAWAAPVAITELGTAAGYSQNPWATPDGLALVFSSDRGGGAGGGDIWLATRASTNDAFGAPVNVAEINDGFFQADPWISADRRYIVFASNVSGTLHLYEAHR